MKETTAALNQLRPQSAIQAEQTRAFIRGLEQDAQTYWDMVQVGDELSRDLHMTPELIILYADGVEDFNPWYEAWRMNSWHIPGESPFGGAIVPPLLVSHFILSVQFDHTRPFAIGSIHTYHDLRRGQVRKARAALCAPRGRCGGRGYRDTLLPRNPRHSILVGRQP